MKSLILLLVAFVLVACANETVEVAPPVVEAPVVEPPMVEEPVMEEPEMEEPEVEDPVTEEPEPEPEVDEPEEEEESEEPEEDEERDEPSSTLPVFNAQSLAEFDGLEGRPAYIALDGVVYDVTGHPMWPNGIHRGQYQAGRDYSVQIPTSHRRDMRYETLPVVGTYE